MAKNISHDLSGESTTHSGSDLLNNKFLELKSCREAERARAVRQGLIPDPLKPRRLDEALPFLGTCLDMCPEFERHEREYQNNSDKWERFPGTFRIDPQKAVKAFHRPAAGNDQPLPSDVRPPDVLKSTLDYLFKILLAKESLFDTHGFIRDRTRSIRQDFTLQNERGPIAIECHERIARYHILCLHFLRDKEGVGSYQEQQELEQVRKVLQSLNEFYDDYRGSNCFWPNEAEFRAYYLLTHLRDSDAARATERLPDAVFNDQRVQSALQLQILAQYGNMSRAAGRRTVNSPATLNAFTRLFKNIASSQTSFFNACLLETDFREIRVSALKALRSAQSKKYGAHVPLVEIGRLCSMSLEECYGFCKACDLTISKGNLQQCTVELHRHAPFDDKPTTFRTVKSPFITAKVTNISIVDLIDGVTNAKFASSAKPTAPAPEKQIHRPPTLSATPTLFPTTFSALSFTRNPISSGRSILSPKKPDSILASPSNHATPLRDQQFSLTSQRSAEHGSSRERTRRSSSLKTPHNLSSLSNVSGSSSAKKAPQKLSFIPPSIPRSPLTPHPSSVGLMNYDPAVANLRAEILSGIVESSISQVARETLVKRSMQAFADERRKSAYVVSRFTRKLESSLLSEFVNDVVFELASSSLLLIYHKKQKRLLLRAAFCKWRDISRLSKSRLSIKRLNHPKEHKFVNDLSSIWAPGSLKRAVTDYLYRKALSRRTLWSEETRVLIITPVESSVVQTWLCCKFQIDAGQKYSRSSINGLSVLIELVDRSVDLLSLEIARFALILVWLDHTDQNTLFSINLMSILRAHPIPSVCCLGISWQSQHSNHQVDHFMDEWHGLLDQVYLSLDLPEVQLEKALQYHWPVPSATAAMSANNADHLLPLTHVWKRMQRKTATLLNAYVPTNEAYLLTRQVKSCLQMLLLRFIIDLVKLLSEYVASMVHPPENQDHEGLVSHTTKALGMDLLAGTGSSNVDQLLLEYQASLRFNTFSLNLSQLLESRAQLALADFFELFGQHLFTAWLDCITQYLSEPASLQGDVSPYSKLRVLLPPKPMDHHRSQLERTLNSTFQLLRNQVVALFPGPLSIVDPNDQHTTMRDQANEAKVNSFAEKNSKRKSDSVTELRSLIHTTREALRRTNSTSLAFD